MEEKVVEQIQNFIPKRSRLPGVLIFSGYVGVVLSITSGLYIFFMTQTLGSIFRELKTEQSPEQIFLGIAAVVVGLGYAIFQIYYGKKLKKAAPLNKRERNIGIVVFLIPLVLSLFTFPATVLSAINPIMKAVDNVIGNPKSTPTPTKTPRTRNNVRSTSNLQTYKNEDYDFEFKYPSEYVQVAEIYKYSKSESSNSLQQSFYYESGGRDFFAVHVHNLNNYRLPDIANGGYIMYNKKTQEWKSSITQTKTLSLGKIMNTKYVSYSGGSEFFENQNHYETPIENYKPENRIERKVLLILDPESKFLIEIISVHKDSLLLASPHKNRDLIKSDLILSTFIFTDNSSERTCGGLAPHPSQGVCPTGYYCKPVGDFPDAPGTCIKE